MKTLIGHMVVGNSEHGTYDITTNESSAYLFVPIADDNLGYYTARGYVLMPVYAEEIHVELVNNQEFDELELLLN
jgi:hypothetical protein